MFHQYKQLKSQYQFWQRFVIETESRGKKRKNRILMDIMLTAPIIHVVLCCTDIPRLGTAAGGSGCVFVSTRST